jgi:hypothetical protein
MRCAGVIRFTHTIRTQQAASTSASAADASKPLLSQYVQSSPEAAELFAVMDANESAGFRTSSAIVELFAAIIAASSSSSPASSSSSTATSSSASARERNALLAVSSGSGAVERAKALRTTASFIARKLVRSKMIVMYKLLAAEDNRIIQSVLRLLVATVCVVCCAVTTDQIA